MDDHHLQHRLKAYKSWKQSLIRTIEGYQVWLDQHELNNADSDRRLQDALNTLESDTLTMAFVAEFSRGKSELINAIFFSDHGQRLLPSDAGSTTKCPTELFYDEHADGPFLQLLPIETRMDDASIRDLKKKPEVWTTFKLDTSKPAQMAEVLNEVVRTKKLSLIEAQRLGFYPEIKINAPSTLVEIPAWRHARINFPHPLLKQGLTILDTPGLNALGSEPELTLHTLASAQVILFVLGADTGVTRSDMEIWKEHIQPGRKDRDKSVAVALNKIDTLWDELKDQDKIDATVQRQHKDVASTLELRPEQVFPISARKALVARIRRDFPLLRDSKIESLESYLSDEILRDRQTILREALSVEIGELIDNSRNIVQSRLDEFQKQQQDIKTAVARNTGLLHHLHTNIQADREKYTNAVKTYRHYQDMIDKDADRLLRTLDMDDLDQVIQISRDEIAGRWTTPGMASSMKSCFGHMHELMQHVVNDGVQLNALASVAYKQMHEEHQLPILSPPTIDVVKLMEAFEDLNERAEDYRRSPKTAIKEQSYVVKQFFLTMVNSARQLLVDANQQVADWQEYCLEPIGNELRSRRDHLTRRIDTFKKVGTSRTNGSAQLEDLSEDIRLTQEQHNALEKMRALMDQHIPFEVINNKQDTADRHTARSA